MPARHGRRPRLRGPAHDRVRGVGAHVVGSTGTSSRSTGRPRAGRGARATCWRDSPATSSSAGRWASPSTRNAVATVKEFVNVRCCRATSAGRARACARCAATRTCRATGPWGSGRSPRPAFLDALEREFGFDASPRARPRHRRGGPGAPGRPGPGLLRDGRQLRVAPSPTPTSPRPRMRRGRLTVHVSTKLNRSHVVTGREALILPALGRTERDRTGGRDQRVTVEDSMSAVHASRGPLAPASPDLRSEVDIVCSLAEATLGKGAVPTACRGPTTGPTTPPSGGRSPTSCRAARRTTRRSTSGVASCCRTLRGTRASSPPTWVEPSSRSAPSTCSRYRRAGCSCRPFGRSTTSSTPRSTACPDRRPATCRSGVPVPCAYDVRCPSRAVADRGVVLRRPLRSGRRLRSPAGWTCPASTHRPADRALALLRRDRAP